MGKDKLLLKILIAAGLFLLGFVAYQILKSGPLTKETAAGLWIFIRIMGLFFLANSLYGLTSGRVFGRSWNKYWGGWLYRDEEPFYYWSYTIGHFIAGIMLLLACR